MAHFPDSGAFYDQINSFWPAGNHWFAGNGFNRAQYFPPLMEGYIQQADVLVAVLEVNSGDLDRNAALNVEVWQVNSNGNPFLSIETGSWTLASTGSIIANSVVAAASAQNTTHPLVSVTMSSGYIGVESAINNPGVFFNAAYKWKLRYSGSGTFAQSSFFAVKAVANAPAPWHAFNSTVAANESLGGNVQDYSNLHGRLYGQVSPFGNNDAVGSHHQEFWTHSLDSVIDRPFQPGTFDSRGQRFTAQGDRITKALIACRWSGILSTGLYCQIFDTNSAADIPGNVVGSASYGIATNGKTISGSFQNLYNGNISGWTVGAWFTFSGDGVAVTSGGNYWLVITAESYAYTDEILDVAWMTYDKTGDRRAFSLGSHYSFVSGNILDDQAHLFELWYTHTPDIAAPSNFTREFPAPRLREFPGFELREFPKP